MSKGREYHRIMYLQDRYKPNRISPHEEVSKEYKSEINKRIHIRHKRNDIEGLLTEINNPATVREEVHAICDEIGNLKVLCRKCKVEQIIAIIILYVQRLHNPVMKEERTRLWNHYELSWKLYGRVIARLLRETRANRCLPREVK